MRASQFNHKHDDAAKQMLAVLIGASAASQTGKSARCWTFASDELATKTNASFASSQYSSLSADICSGGTPSASSFAGAGSEADKAFDDNSGSVWTSGAGSAAWLKYVFGTGKIVRQYTVHGSTSVDRNPSSWTFEGSSDGATWTTLATVTGQTGWASNEKRTFQVSNTTSYTQYRINITANNGGGYVNISEMEMMVVGDFTLVPSAITVASAPTRMTVFFLVQPVDTITLNTDLKAEVSRDGGTNWSAYGNLRLVEAYDATYGLYKADLTAASLPATGTSLLWRLTSYNNKQINVRGAALFWEL